jgi:hypothetical protein
MPQSTILAAAATLGTSTDVVVASGTMVTVGIFTASATIASDVEIEVYQDTPGRDAFIGKLSASNQATLLTGPGTFRLIRRAISQAVGVYLET